jgi:phosphoglycolate phosphatase
VLDRNSTRFDLVIFDWDGTLMDSLAQIVRSVKLAALDLGVPEPSDAAARDIIGLGLPEAMQVLFPQVPEVEREALRHRYAHHFVAGVGGHSQPYAGAEALLQQLSGAGRQLAVATGKSRAGLNRVLAHTGWSSYFSATRCADETASKPNPLMLKELLLELRVPLERAVMIGDTHYDLEMAQRLGMPSIGVSYGVHSAERLAEHAPIAICQDMSELASTLAAL